ncbi:MAG: hypothetical protein ACRCTY_07835, partial [Candidatus Adiutrix sp.]
RNRMNLNPTQTQIEAATARFIAGSSHISDDSALTHLSNSKIMGTHQYFSPEAADGHTAPRPSFDLWALTLSALECFIGHRPWEMGGMVGEALESYCQGPMAVTLNPPMRDFFQKALAENEKSRFQNAGRLASRLTEIYEQVAGHPYPRPHPLPLKETASRLNNKAVSFMSLAQPHEAFLLWEKAIEMDSKHAASILNQKLDLFSQNLISADDLKICLKQLENAEYMAATSGDLGAALACVWLELGDLEKSKHLLNSFTPSCPNIKLRRYLTMILKSPDNKWEIPIKAPFLLSPVI